MAYWFRFHRCSHKVVLPRDGNYSVAWLSHMLQGSAVIQRKATAFGICLRPSHPTLYVALHVHSGFQLISPQPSSRVLTRSAFKRRFNSSLSSGESFMSLSRHSRIAHHLKTPLTLEQICGIVEEIVQFWPRILTEATSNHSLLRFYCQRQLHECRTSTWLLEQSKKRYSVAVLPKLALEYYVRLWGPKPHT